MIKSGKYELETLKQNVQQKFAEIRAAATMREKLLLRQLDVIVATTQQQLGRGNNNADDENGTTTPTNDRDVKFLVEEEAELLAAIRSFGRFQLGNMNMTLQDIYLRNEDYITPANDHETMYKCLATDTDGDALEEESEQPETIVVDFSKNKSLIEHNARHMNKSIINITLQEAKDLIKKAKMKRDAPIPPLNLEELDDELESSIAEAVSSLGVLESSVVSATAADGDPNTKSSQANLEAKKAKGKRFKPKITINNCNGTINLRNISSLTINCASEESMSAEIPLKQCESEQEIVTDSTLASSKTTQKQNLREGPTEKRQAQAIVSMDSNSTGNSTPTTTASSSNYSSNASSRSQSKKQKASKKAQSKANISNSTTSTSASASAVQPTTATAYTYPYELADDDDDANVVTCDFYNRLLNEIKNSLKEKSKRTAMLIDNAQYATGGARSATDSATCCGDANSNVSSTCVSAEASSSTQPAPGKRLVLKNFENLKIVLEANSDEESFPVQIEQWLAEIVSETDLEPMQNTEILEHSKIHNEST